MRCGNCGHKLTAAALALGYCPHCGAELRKDAGAEAQHALVQEEHKAPADFFAAPPPTPALPPPAVPDYTLSPRASAPHPSLMTFPPPPPGEAPATNEHSPPAGPPPAPRPPLIVTSAQSPAPPPPPHAPAAASPSVNTPPPPAAPPVIVVPARKSSAAPAIIGTLLVLLALVGGGLLVAGNNGQGPLAAFVHNTHTSTGVSGTSPTAVPVGTATAAPTATAIPPTATPAPPTATPAPSVPAPPAGFKTFISTDGVFGLNYPTDWTTGNTPLGGFTDFSFTSPTTSFEAVTVDEFSSTIQTSDIVTSVRNFAASSNGTNVTVVQGAKSQQIGTNTWMTAIATYDANDGEHKVIGLAINHGSSGVLFFYDAPIGSYHTDPGSNYDTMVKSFTFLH
jgi:hypothetical protein